MCGECVAINLWVHTPTNNNMNSIYQGCVGNEWPSIYGCIHLLTITWIRYIRDVWGIRGHQFMGAYTSYKQSVRACFRFLVVCTCQCSTQLMGCRFPVILSKNNVKACYQRTCASRKSFQHDLLGGRMSPALFGCSSVSPCHACCCHSCSERIWFYYGYLTHWV